MSFSIRYCDVNHQYSLKFQSDAALERFFQSDVANVENGRVGAVTLIGSNENQLIQLIRFTSLKALKLINSCFNSLSEPVSSFSHLTTLRLMNVELNSTQEQFKLLSLQSLVFINSKIRFSYLQAPLLQNLEMSEAGLKEWPHGLESMPHLTALNFSRNKMTFIAKQISVLTELRLLNVSYNKLTELPTEIKFLTHLNELSIHDNQISALPSGITRLKSLTHFYYDPFNLENLSSFNRAGEIPSLSSLICVRYEDTLLSFILLKTFSLPTDLEDFIHLDMDRCTKCAHKIYEQAFRIVKLGKFVMKNHSISVPLALPYCYRCYQSTN